VNAKRGHYADLGALYIQMGRYEEAKEKLEEALKNNPDDAYAHIEIGDLYLQTEEVKEAIREFRMAAVIDPHNPVSFKALAIALMENNKLSEAKRALRNCIGYYKTGKIRLLQGNTSFLKTKEESWSPRSSIVRNRNL
jgi:predicted Zn-dependent protease